MIFTVEELIEGQSKPLTVSRDKPMLEAVALMAEHDFSQLPVVTSDEMPIGLITSDSILKAATHFGVRVSDLKVNDALQDAKTTRFDGDLFELLDEVQRHYAVLVLDAHGRLGGIVTHYDTTSYFRRRAEDTMVIEDIETTLKELITAIYKTDNHPTGGLSDAITEVANHARKLRRKYELALKTYFKITDQPQSDISSQAFEDSFKCFGQREQPKGLDDLTLEEFTDVLLRHEQCPKIGANRDPSGVRQLLGAVRDTRNVLAHFRGDITSEQRDKLRFCSNWLRRALADLSRAYKAPIAQLEPPALRTAKSDDAPLEEEPADTESAYSPILSSLQSIPVGQDEVVLPFTQIEQIIGRKLPASAREHRAWWANDRSHAHARQWLDAGWKVKTVSGESVVFSKAKEREEAYIRFFIALVASLKLHGRLPPSEAKPNGRSYFCSAILHGTVKRQLPVYASFARNGRLRVEIYLGLGDKTLNKSCWQRLFDQRLEIEQALGEPLAWEKLDGKSSARIALYEPGPLPSGTDLELIPWATKAVIRFVDAFRDPARKALDALHS